MDDQKFSLQGVIQKLKEYLKTTKDLTLLKAVQKLSGLISTIVTDTLLVVFGFFLLLFLSVSLGFYFAELFDSNALGFLALGGFYLLLIIILLVTKKSIEKGLMNLSIRKFLQKWNETHDDKQNNQ